MDRRTVAQIAAALIAFGLCLGAYVALVLTGHDGDALVRTAIVLAGLFGVGSGAAAGFRQTHQKLDQVAHQTNGALDARIRAAVAEARADGQASVTDPGEAPSAPLSAPQMPTGPEVPSRAPASARRPLGGSR